MTLAPQLADALLEELVQVVGGEYVMTSKTARYARARVPAPFPCTAGRSTSPTWS